ncbi:cytidylyltransferase domain-containing protein [Arthrobacter sp. STN4]|uniref:cytidylyltransferase domain-containing protein n=1 Tax=Arthrobacter sp. STN4 TaxID=2923276 RepID=UPI002119C214|nr:glycosyltransferase family protein [Arthrobacter sp. STN4]MCQ9163670.1 glycosyltransferase family protein [Arthrobacter sp. STN4]
MSSRVVAVVQARMGSNRLPGKVLRDLAGTPVLGWVVRAASQSSGIDEIVVATSTSAQDDPVADFALTQGVRVVRGSEMDVLGRFLMAIEETNADAVVRLTADCPLLDPRVISQVVSIWRNDPQLLDYVSTTQNRSLPRGLDVELVTSSALRAVGNRTEAHHRAHVTSAVYEAGAGFKLASLQFNPGSAQYRVTLDTEADAALLDALAPHLQAVPPSWQEVVSVLEEFPEIALLNSHVEQKALTEG